MISGEVDTSVSGVSCSFQHVTLVATVQDSHFLCNCALRPIARSLSLTVYHVLWNAQVTCERWSQTFTRPSFPACISQDLADQIRAETPATVGLQLFLACEIFFISAPQQQSSKYTYIKQMLTLSTQPLSNFWNSNVSSWKMWNKNAAACRVTHMI